MRSSPVIEISPPSSGTAIFQHNPKGDATLRREWEPGCQPDELYDAFLPAWRASLRGLLVRRLRNESTQMADWQKRVRSEARDRYFYWTAVFGSKCSFFCIICNPHHCAKFETCWCALYSRSAHVFHDVFTNSLFLWPSIGRQRVSTFTYFDCNWSDIPWAYCML